MSEIRILSPEDFDVFIDVAADAYPGWDIFSSEEKERIKKLLLEAHQKEPTVTFYGLFRNERLLGGMRFHDFRMNFLHARILAGGVGLVAVDFLHKREHVAKEMIEYFLRHYRQRGAPIALLYPFRPDFYKQMGFGIATKMNQYRLRPTALPAGPSRAHVRYLGKDDRQALVACYNRYLDRTHGMIEKSDREVERLFTNPKSKVVGYERDGQVLGYLLFTFERGESFILNDLQVHEFITLNPEALSELLTFLRSQADQIRHVIWNTLDDSFHHLLLDARRDGSTRLIPSVYHESNVQGVGLMVRLIDTVKAFDVLRERDFGGQTCRLSLVVEDSFLPENAGRLLLSFEGGSLRLPEGGGHDLEMRIDIADLSSLLMGAVSFKSLHRYGLVKLSDPTGVDVLDRIFWVEKPICTTPF